jgi:hypothetical protein
MMVKASMDEGSGTNVKGVAWSLEVNKHIHSRSQRQINHQDSLFETSKLYAKAPQSFAAPQHQGRAHLRRIELSLEKVVHVRQLCDSVTRLRQLKLPLSRFCGLEERITLLLLD